jgi:hypothetical protein
MEYRWQVVAVEGGRVQHVEPFRALKPAQKRADVIAAKMDPDRDDVAIFDFALGKVIYNPLTGLDLYERRTK